MTIDANGAHHDGAGRFAEKHQSAACFDLDSPAGLHAVADSLDSARNGLGDNLTPEVRARVFAAIDDPGPDTWWGPKDEDGDRFGGASGVLVARSTTLWQATLAHTDYAVNGRGTGEDATAPTREQILTALQAVAPAQPEHQPVNDPVLGEHLKETHRQRRGHDFYPTTSQRAATPRLYDTEDVPAAHKTVHAHYFVGSADWYVVEADWQEGTAVGYTDLGLGHGEWGYIPLAQIEELKVGSLHQPVERDLDFEPTPFGDLRPRGA